MANSFYPQLSTGSLAQYPIRRESAVRTVQNVLRDGTVIAYPDSGASVTAWELQYGGLSQLEVAALKALFDACSGALSPFTFLDPTGNALSWSSDLTNSVWQRSALVSIAAGTTDPTGGNHAFQLINNGQDFEEVTQIIQFPSNYQYCFSIYAVSQAPATLILVRRGSNTEDQSSCAIEASYSRVVSQGALNDSGSTVTVGVRLAPGQSVTLYGPQLEAQKAASPYRSTANQGAVYPTCYWAGEEFLVSANSPETYSTIVRLETNC